MLEKKLQTAGIALAVLFLASCSGKNQSAAKSMEQIYAEKGRPVEIRTVLPQSFSAFLEYPAEFRARTQSTAYAKISDVVRTISVHVGQKVKRDDIILSFSLDNSDYQQAKMSYGNAQLNYNRMKSLFAAAGVSRQDYDNAQTQYQLAAERFRSVSELVYVKSPIDGYITQLNVQTSANVNPGDALFTVSNQDGFEAYFYVMPEEIGDIQPGEKALVKGRQETIEGRVTEVSLNLDPVRKAFLVKAFFAGKPKTLVSGMNVDISVEVYKNSAALVMNQKELVSDGSSWAAYVVKDGTAQKQDVVFGRQQGIAYEITDGIAKGDKLVTVGAQNLSDGEKVNIITPALVKADNSRDALR
jgi:membrane fusion protein, multidrug efflux system